ncbi:MAG: hypothetical protein V4631_17375 [Pseudomonadota bacterium]
MIAEAVPPRRASLLLIALAYAGSATLQKGLGFVLFMWLAHALSVQDYARFGLFFALQTGVAALAAAGISESVVGMLNSHQDALARRALFGSANVVFALLALVSAALGAAVYGIWGGAIGATALDVAMVTAAGVASAFFTLQSLLTRLNEDHKASLHLSFVPALAGLLAGFVGFAAFHSVTSFFFGTVCGLAATMVYYQLSGAAFDGFVLSRPHYAGILSRIGPFILIVILGWLSGYGNTYLVKALFAMSDVARFTFAFTLSSVMQLIASSLNQVWSPKFYKLVHEQGMPVVEAGNRRFYLLQGAVMGALGALVLLLAPMALDLAGAGMAAYTGLELELFLLFAAYAVAIPWWHVQNFYFAHSRGAELMYVVLATSAFGLLAWLGAMWLWGSTGVYVGFALMMLLRSAGAYLWARRLWPLRLMWEGPAIALVLLGAATMVAMQLR